MRRRRFRKQYTGMSLFPFLAVLICTMGALIVLLVLGVQQAQVRATEVAGDQAAERESLQKALAEKRQKAEDAQWKWDVLIPSHVEKAQELTQQRHRLGHLEQHIRELEERWKQLQKDAQQLRANASEGEVKKKAEQLDRLNAEIKVAEAKLDEVKRQLKTRPRSFSLVPYDGPNGTKRRPLYVECTRTGIHLRPENIKLTEEDFQPPFGAGNPLASALRAKRDFLSSQGLLGPGNEPYPLLVVRPGGSVYYALARQLMKSWDDEFGYELVAEEMSLKFPPVNDEMRAVVQRAIESAKQRQEFIARSRPSLYRGRGGRGLGSSSQSGGGSSRTGQPGGSFGRSLESRSGSSSTATSTNRTGPSNQQASRSNSNSNSASTGIRNGPDGPGGPNSSRGFGQFGGGGSLGPQRGKNWGLPQSEGRGLKRYVRVVCEANRLTILPAQDERARPRVVTLKGDTQQNIEPFVNELWQYMKTWGLALPGRYWEPILSVEVANGGEQRFREFQNSLRQSGVIVKRRQ